MGSVAALRYGLAASPAATTGAYGAPDFSVTVFVVVTTFSPAAAPFATAAFGVTAAVFFGGASSLPEAMLLSSALQRASEKSGLISILPLGDIGRIRVGFAHASHQQGGDRRFLGRVPCSVTLADAAKLLPNATATSGLGSVQMVGSGGPLSICWGRSVTIRSAGPIVTASLVVPKPRWVGAVFGSAQPATPKPRPQSKPNATIPRMTHPPVRHWGNTNVRYQGL